jgi:hypothetical protein
VQFFLRGFSDDMGFRVFAFEGVAADQKRSNYSVRADISLIRGYGIRVQELPLLCRKLLEFNDEPATEHTLTYTKEHMRVHAANCVAEREAAQRLKSKHRRPHAAAQPQPEL